MNHIIKKYYKSVITFNLLMLLFACVDRNPNQIDVSNIEVKMVVERFDQQFFNTTDLQALKKKFPYLFPIKTPDSIWHRRINDTDQRFLFESAQIVFDDFSLETAQLTELFKHVKYYDSTFVAPKIITLISGVDADAKVIYADSLLFISLDMFLGESHEVYAGFPKYLSANFNKSQLIVKVAKALATLKMARNTDNTFLGRMIAHGKLLYLLDRYLPNISDPEKIGYSQAQHEWTNINESEMWKYFIEKKLLFSTDASLSARFIDQAPFSKFYLAIDNDSPGRVGVWMGWQIVRSFMKNNEVMLDKMLALSSEELFKRSKYKPRK